MTEVIAVVSGKGGVGKTTLVSNLSVSLTNMGKSVLVIDANVTGPNLGLHLGVPTAVPVSLNDVLSGNEMITQAIYKHSSGFSIIPASLTELGGNIKDLKYLLFDILGAYDFIIIDAAAGADDEVVAAVEACDRVILITNPEIPAVTNAALVKKLIDKASKPILGVIVNRKRGEKYELKDKDIEKFLELSIISKVPEYSKVREAIAFGIPVVKHKPHSESSFAIDNVARAIVGEEQKERSLFDKIRGFVDDYF